MLAVPRKAVRVRREAAGGADGGSGEIAEVGAARVGVDRGIYRPRSRANDSFCAGKVCGVATPGHAPDELLSDIALRLNEVRANGNRTAVMHWVMLRYSEDLQTMSGRDFCERVGLLPSYEAEFNKMIRLGRFMR